MNEAERRRRERLGQVAELLREKSGPGRAEEAAELERFLRRYAASLAPDDVAAATPEGLLAACASLWRLGGERPPGEAKVRVFNPTLAEDGWQCGHSVAEIVNDDMPFLVSSVAGALNLRGRTVHLVAHPLARVVRDPAGRRLRLVDRDPADAAAEGAPESYIHLEFDQETDSGELKAIADGLAAVLADVRAAVADWSPMLARIGALADEFDGHPPRGAEPVRVAEAVAFLRWLADDHFLFLGYREYALVHEGGADYLRPDAASGLGILRTLRPASVRRAATPLSPAVSAHARLPDPLFVTKAYDRSTVHRQVHLDYVGVRRFDAAGEVTGERRFVGLFTSGVYDDSVRRVPLLRGKIEEVVRRTGFVPKSHDDRALLHILETLPRDELFQMSVDELLDLALGVLHLQERQQLRLFVRRDPFDRFVSCLVYVPRDRYTTPLGEEMKRILAEAFAGAIKTFDIRVGDSPLARLLLVVETRAGSVPPYDVAALEARLAELARSWSDHLREALVVRCGEDRGLALLRRFAEAFPAAYQEAYGAAEAVDDLLKIEELLARRAADPSGGESDLGVNLYRPAGLPAERVRFKTYRCGPPRPLSDVMPMLENLGFKVMTEASYELEPADGGTVWVRDFSLRTTDGASFAVEPVRERLEETFRRVWAGEVESDPFNALVAAAGLTWRQAAVLRAYYRFQLQAKLAFSLPYTARALAGNPAVTRLLVEWFESRFDPVPGHPGRRRAAQVASDLRQELAKVASLDDDRILRRFRSLIRATLRTNYFQTTPEGGPKPYLALKFDSRSIRRLPEPKPMFEVFVYSPRVEAVHLRGGKVARGGVRWSDRPEDFRTEILGLVKAQMVKNAVIIPVGAKGGFVVKRPPVGGTREQLQAEGVECYRTLVRGLLDLTDNLVGDEVVPPPDVVRKDGDDPYLVVAADKGTATFSDIANAVAAEYGFWLGDAFASGGSAGYDHKAMGITARGAWEAVKRHFRELGSDIQSEPFTVVGVGDMSGDVFGNGMLLSPQIRLLAAFDHRHVFVDPDPDCALSFAERRRLFALPRSAWADYDPARISSGGGVWERGAKAIPVSPEMQALFGLDRATATPNELIRALLRAPVDLLWFGGIGTFVKAADESHADAGDRVNEEVRVDGRDLRCRVIGEGANLGLTQRGRVEYALAGGRLNTDAIDNSAGVDTSDHEVNIKILFGDAALRDRVSREERNRLLAEMTDEVAALVLRDNYLQTQALSIAESEVLGRFDAFAGTLRELERSGRLDRAIEFLPGDEELARRRAAGRGLVRPELAVLLAYAKIALYQDLTASDLPDAPELVSELARYFPERLRREFPQEIARHRLRREIIATHVVNSMVNRVGPTFVHRMTAESGATPVDVARAYTIARDAGGLRALWAGIEALDNRVPAGVQLEMILDIARWVERTTLWLLRHRRQELDVAARVGEILPAGKAMLDALESILPGEELAAFVARQDGLVARGVPAELARPVAAAPALGSVVDVTGIARGGTRPVVDVARAYFGLGARFALDGLRRRAAAAGAAAHADRWASAAAEALVQDLFAAQSEMTARVLAQADPATGTAAAAAAWIAGRAVQVAALDQLLAEVAAAPAADLPLLTLVSHQVRSLVGHG